MQRASGSMQYSIDAAHKIDEYIHKLSSYRPINSPTSESSTLPALMLTMSRQRRNAHRESCINTASPCPMLTFLKPRFPARTCGVPEIETGWSRNYVRAHANSYHFGRVTRAELGWYFRESTLYSSALSHVGNRAFQEIGKAYSISGLYECLGQYENTTPGGRCWTNQSRISSHTSSGLKHNDVQLHAHCSSNSAIVDGCYSSITSGLISIIWWGFGIEFRKTGKKKHKMLTLFLSRG